MKNKILIIIQGPLGYENVLNHYFKDFTILYSTWKGQEYNDKYSDNVNILYNKLPKNGGNRNIKYQQKSTFLGIKKGIEMGFEYCVKWRSDMLPTNFDVLIKDLDLDKINLLFEVKYIHYYSKLIRRKTKYYCDYVQIGKTRDLYNIWDFDKYKCKFPEELITNNINKNFNEDSIELIGKNLDYRNDIYWLKRNIYLSSYKNYEQYRIE